MFYMAPPKILDIDPRLLHLTSSPRSGADRVKLHDQMVRYASSVGGMSPVLAYQGLDEAIVIYDGVTRATRVARVIPGSDHPGRGDAEPQQADWPSALTGRHAAMTSSELKQDILRALSELVEHTPDVRFGQLIANLAVIARGPSPKSVWDMEDDELLEAVKTHIEDYERRQAGVA